MPCWPPWIDPCPPGEPEPAGRQLRRRQSLLVVIIVCCVGLAAWIGVLAVTLPRYYRTGGWRGAWVGFDIARARHVRGHRLGRLAQPPGADHAA